MIFLISYGGTPAELREETGCGYLLSITKGNYKVDEVVNFLKGFNDKIRVFEEKKCIYMPTTLESSDAIIALDENKEKLGIEEYTVHTENLEDNLLKFIEEHEN